MWAVHKQSLAVSWQMVGATPKVLNCYASDFQIWLKAGPNKIHVHIRHEKGN